MLSDATRSSVRITNGNTCGSGVIFYLQQFTLILTNAHVAGNKGNKVKIQTFWPGSKWGNEYQGTVIAAAYRRGTNVDFAIVRIETPVHGAVAVRLCMDGRCSQAPGWTGGSPRCEPTSYRNTIWLNDANDQVDASRPIHIGGQSGSGIQQEMKCVSLVTWADRSRGLSQKMSHIYAVLNGERAAVSAIPDDWIPACDNPCQPKDEMAFELADLPAGIWTTCEGQNPPGPEPDPDCPEENRRRRDWITILLTFLEYLPQLLEFLEKILEEQEARIDKKCGCS